MAADALPLGKNSTYMRKKPIWRHTGETAPFTKESVVCYRILAQHLGALAQTRIGALR